MIRLTPWLLVATASVFAGVGSSPTDARIGGVVDRLRSAASPECPAKEESWDVALIHQCGYWSHFDHRTMTSSWPVPLTANLAELGTLGAVRRALHEVPQEGDVLLRYNVRRKAFIGAAIVAAIIHSGRNGTEPYYDVRTIEGDTNRSGQRRAGMAMFVNRRMSPSMGDRVLRWADLEARPVVADEARVAAFAATLPRMG